MVLRSKRSTTSNSAKDRLAMHRNLDDIKGRYELTMGRIAGLVQLVFSDIPQLKPTGFLEYTGASADLLRSTTVFLHAAFEDLVRSLSDRRTSWSFHSRTDLEKRLKHAGIEPTAFKSLYPPLTQLAKRRHRIVHHADLTPSTIQIAPSDYLRTIGNSRCGTLQSSAFTIAYSCTLNRPIIPSSTRTIGL